MADEKTEVVNADDKKTDNGEKKKVTFDADQQTLVNNIIDQAYTKAYEKADAKRKEEVTALQLELDGLKALAAKDTKKDDKVDDKKDDKKPAKKSEHEEEINALRAQVDELMKGVDGLRSAKDAAEQRAQKIEETNKQTTIKDKFIQVADKFEFFDRMDVFALTKDQLALNDEGDVVIINPATKQPRKNAELRDMSLDEFLSDFATKKPQMVRSKNSGGGTGGGENRKVDLSDKKDIPDYAKMSKEEFQKLTQNVQAKQYERK
jgi:hypothetical protein